jgi:hypothetical protein
MNDTVFSTKAFADAWSHHIGDRTRPLALKLQEFGIQRTVYALARTGRSGFMNIEFGPAGFYGSPGWQATLDDQMVEDLLAQTRGPRVRCFTWNVRFDHVVLAESLERHGLKSERVRTQILYLEHGYEKAVGSFSQAIRNNIRRAKRNGVIVRVTDKIEDLVAYYRVHKLSVERKGGFTFIFPCKFLGDLVKGDRLGRLFVAEFNDIIIGGGIFLRDGDSVFYLHGAYDQRYAKMFPTCAILNEAILWACEIGAKTFNFGGSAGIESLEKFKSYWGAQYACIWRFIRQNSSWALLDSAIRRIRQSCIN